MTQGKDFLLYGHRMTEWQRVRPLAQGIAYFDSKTKMAYSHIDYLTDDVRRRLLQKQAFESHSKRAYFIVENNELNEYKGLTLPYSDEIVPASGQPRGLLLKEHGEREASALNDIAENGGNVKAEYHDVGLASLKREGSKIEVRPLTAEDGEIIHYGVLRRWGSDYISFIRLDLFQIVRQLAIMEGVDHIVLLSNALARFGRVLRTAHELGIYHCFTHPGNIDAHGNLIDYEHAIYRDEIPVIKEKLMQEDTALFSEDSLRFRDIDLFFGGTRDVITKCQETYKLDREGLMMQIRFLRDNISLSVGIPVFESLAHVNIGFYEDTLKKLPTIDQKRIIGAFVDEYCPASDQVKDRVFSALARAGEWTEEVTGFICNPENPKSLGQISGEFILGLWDRQPLKLLYSQANVKNHVISQD
uniref:Uncharacterized protein n=1 Tax=Candidatus Methanophaga sp. ANME-1 ERB7 TaxID=2759913 RepID=A0A7G9Z4X9_9EURY|nr:hypothetical protein NDMCNHHP_00013 [Methanosarcinales archaeon ANME-1 ERB7]